MGACRATKGESMHHFTVEGKLIRLNADDHFSREEFAQMLPAVEQTIETHGKARLLLDVRDLKGMTPDEVWHSLKLSERHLNNVERAAIIGDEGWERWLEELGDDFEHAEVRVFTAEAAAQAESWLQEGA
jgi:hypothetical protein